MFTSARLEDYASMKYRLGLDLGSISLKSILLDSSGRIVFNRYERTGGRPLQTVLGLLEQIRARMGNISFSGAVATGSGKELIANPTGMDTVNEIIAHATAAWTAVPQVESIIEIGGQDSKFIRLGTRSDGTRFIRDHAFNELCAAGTGAFLDQQAQRLGLEIAAFGELACKAGSVTRIAGRCSVFAKSDMIHLQQKAAPKDEIAAGLCYALARNYIANLCRGDRPLPPVCFQGGVAANRGVVRAFKDILGLDESGLIVPELFDVTGAFGAALIAGGSPLKSSLTLADITERLSSLKGAGIEPSDLEPLEKRAPATARSRRGAGSRGAKELFMGLDVGSISTKAVIVDRFRNLVAFEYLATSGNPVDAIKKAIGGLKSGAGEHAGLSNVVSTGSGRHLAAALLGTGTTIDEISAQAASTSFFFPDADTVFEIGGQDAKFIRISGKTIEKFQMNRACAAGTGAFLEEQAGRLGIDIKGEFSDAAFNSASPVRLGNRCTVFMDSDLVHHLQKGASAGDLCAGLAYSIAGNYLEKVVGSSPIGSRIVFQGGVAGNSAVCAAFEKLLGRHIAVHPYPEISGALGAAFTAIEESAGKKGSGSFKLRELDFSAVSESFECSRCENCCEIRKITVEGERTAYFGSVCGRFELSGSKPIAADDAFSIREKLLLECLKSSSLAPFRGELGIPMTLTMSDYLPFWATFFRRLGYRLKLSDPSDRSAVEEGLMHVPAEFCYPVKVLFGHVLNLIRKGLKKIFIPHLRMFTPPGESLPRYACPYTQAAPYVVQKNFSSETEIMTFEYPVEGEIDWWIGELSKGLEIPGAEVRKAYESARNAQNLFQETCRRKGRELLADLKSRNRRAAVLIGRPYNTTDRYINLNLARRMKALGIEPIPFDFLPLGSEPLPPLWERIRWGYGRKLVQAARILKKQPHLGAVIVTNFGCGPDAFIDQYLEHELRGVPHILIELDDHQAEAGLVTRLEAFSRNFAIRKSVKPPLTGRDPGKPRRRLKEYTYYVPAFMDHAYAITGALKASGCKTVLLPPTDESSWNLGLKHAYGRECHPFIAFTGDLLKAALSPDFKPEEACYFGPSYFGPCLLPQYPLALHLILERLGLAGVTVMNITDPTNMKELGIPYLIRMVIGLYAIDRMYKWKTEIEPYETRKGEVDRVYRSILLDLEKGLAQGSFFRKLRESVAGFKRISLAPDTGSRPKIGIVGDVYTRANEHSNDHLYRRLNQSGFEVWTSCSLIDVSFLGMEQWHAELSRLGRTNRGIAAKALIPMLKIVRGFLDFHFPPTIRTPQERQYPQIHKACSKYAGYWIDRVLSLNINRIEEFHQAGADGIINVMCHNCMLGTITASLSKSIRSGINETPLCSLVYEGLKSTHNLNRLEAFAHQVKSFGADCR